MAVRRTNYCWNGHEDCWNQFGAIDISNRTHLGYKLRSISHFAPINQQSIPTYDNSHTITQGYNTSTESILVPVHRFSLYIHWRDDNSAGEFVMPTLFPVIDRYPYVPQTKGNPRENTGKISSDALTRGRGHAGSCINNLCSSGHFPGCRLFCNPKPNGCDRWKHIKKDEVKRGWVVWITSPVRFSVEKRYPQKYNGEVYQHINQFSTYSGPKTYVLQIDGHRFSRTSGHDSESLWNASELCIWFILSRNIQFLGKRSQFP